MKFNSYMYLLTFMSIITAQDDNPSGHELGMVDDHGNHDHHIISLDDSTSSSTKSSSSFTSTTSTSSSTSTSSVDDSTNVNFGARNVVGLINLLTMFLIL